MSGWSNYLYYEDSDMQAVRLAYQNSDSAMYIFLPSKYTSAHKLMGKLGPTAWQEKTAAFKLREGHLRLPRFQVRWNTDLSGVLGRIGMEMAFDPQRAELEAIGKPANNLWIGKVFHQALVEVNEEGTEAAALSVPCFMELARDLPKGQSRSKWSWTIRSFSPFVMIARRRCYLWALSMILVAEKVRNKSGTMIQKKASAAEGGVLLLRVCLLAFLISPVSWELNRLRDPAAQFGLPFLVVWRKTNIAIL